MSRRRRIDPAPPVAGAAAANEQNADHQNDDADCAEAVDRPRRGAEGADLVQSGRADHLPGDDRRQVDAEPDAWADVRGRDEVGDRQEAGQRQIRRQAALRQNETAQRQRTVDEEDPPVVEWSRQVPLRANELQGAEQDRHPADRGEHRNPRRFERSPLAVDATEHRDLQG